MSTTLISWWMRIAQFLGRSLLLGAALGALSLSAAPGIQWVAINVPTVNCYIGSNVQFTATVTNPVGADRWNTATRLEVKDHTGRILYSPSVANINPGETTTVTFYMTLPSAVGTFEFTFCAKQEGTGPGTGYFGDPVPRTIAVQFQPTVPVGANGQVWLSSYNFLSVLPPAITTNWTTPPHYRLRAKFAVPDNGLGFHAATSSENKGKPLDAVPPPGYYPTMTQYWLRYDENYVLQEIGPSINHSVSISDPPVTLSSYWVNNAYRPTVLINQNLPQNYKLVAEIINPAGAVISTLTREWNNDTRFLADLPGPGTYNVRTHWEKYDLGGTEVIGVGTMRTQSFTVVDGPVQILAGSGWLDHHEIYDEFGELISSEDPMERFFISLPSLGNLRLSLGNSMAYVNYRLMNADEQQVAGGEVWSSRDVTINGVPPGSYHLEIGSPSDGYFTIYLFQTPLGARPTVTTNTLAAGVVGVPYPEGVFVKTDLQSLTGNEITYHAELPLGLYCNPTTGKILGTPVEAGEFDGAPGHRAKIRLWASNNEGDSATKEVSLSIAKATPVVTFANRTFVNEPRMHAITAAMLNATIAGLPNLPPPTALPITYRVSQGTNLTPTGSNPLGKYLSPYDQPVVKITATYPGDSIYAETTVEATFRDVIAFTPTPPAEVRAVLRSSGGFSLAWQSAGGVPVGITTSFQYEISVDGGQTVVATVPYGQLSSVVTGRAAATQYAVSVRARDSFGNESSWSTPQTVATLAAGEVPVTTARWLSFDGGGLRDEVFDAAAPGASSSLNAGIPVFEHSVVESTSESVTYTEWVQYWTHIPGYTYTTGSYLDDYVRRYYVPAQWEHDWAEETQEISVPVVRPEFRSTPRDGYIYKVGRLITRPDGTCGLNEVYTINPDDTIDGINRWLPVGFWGEPAYYTIPFVLVRKSLAPSGCVLNLPGMGTTATANAANGTITLGNGTKITAGGNGATVTIPGVGTVTIGTNGSVSVAGGGALPSGVTHSPGVPSLGLPGGITVNPGTDEVTIAGPAGSSVTVGGTGGIRVSLPPALAGIAGVVGRAVDILGNILGGGTDPTKTKVDNGDGKWRDVNDETLGQVTSLGTQTVRVGATDADNRAPQTTNILTIQFTIRRPADLAVVHPVTGDLSEYYEDTGIGGLVAIKRTDNTPTTKLKITTPSGGNANSMKYRLFFSAEDRFAIFRDAGRTQIVISGQTEFDGSSAVLLYLEGKKKSRAKGGERIVLQQKEEGSSVWTDADSVLLTVVQAEFLFQVKSFIPYAWTEAEDIPGPDYFLNPLYEKVVKGDFVVGVRPSFKNVYSDDLPFPAGTFDLAPFRVCQMVVLTPYEHLHPDPYIISDRRLMTAPLSEHFMKATAVDPAELGLIHGYVAPIGLPTSFGKPPSQVNNYTLPGRSNYRSELTIEGAAKDGAMPGMLLVVPPSVVTYFTTDIHWKLKLIVDCGADPLQPKAGFDGVHDSFPSYEIIVQQSDGTFREVRRYSPSSTAKPGPDSLSDSNAVYGAGSVPVN